MAEVRFYHLKTQRVEQALPALLAKAYENGHKIVVKATDKERLKQLSEHLWTFNPASFLPHGTKKEGLEHLQPIFLTIEDDNPAEADVLITIDGAEFIESDKFALKCKIFSDHDKKDLKAARSLWKLSKESGALCTYWKQTPQGWEKQDL